MRPWIIVISLAAAGLTALWAGGQTAAPQNDEAGLRQAAAAYAAALQAGDLKNIGNCWSNDADFVNVEGTCIKGRDKIVNLYRDGINDYKSGKVKFGITAIRFLTPDVAVMDGTVDFNGKDGDIDHSRFSTVWARKDGKWIIASARSIADTAEEAVANAVSDLKWLIGDWTAESGATKIKLSCKPDLGNKFLRMEFHIQGANEPITVVQYVGWDPTEAAVRTWTLDSRGGFGQGLWTREASMWQGETAGTLPSGQVATALTNIRMNGPDSFVWQATEREVEGQPIPDSEIKYTRVAATR